MSTPWIIGDVQLLIRLFVALLLGSLIGFERERNNHHAGLRTHILVCMGSALAMLLSVYGFSEFTNETNVRVDPARLGTAVITGIGFLGAGTIISTGKAITGLTTAASLWVVAIIGLAAGAGFYFAATVTAFLVVIILWIFNKIELRFLGDKKTCKIMIQADASPDLVDIVSGKLMAKSIIMKKMAYLEKKAHSENQQAHVELQLNIVAPKYIEPNEIIIELKEISGVYGVSFE